MGFKPCLALDKRGAGIVVWVDGRNGDLDIYGRGLGPRSPLNATAGDGFDGLVPLTWDPIYAIPDITIYNIYRSTSAVGLYSFLASVDVSQRGFTGLQMPHAFFTQQMRDYVDVNVTNGTTYYYKVSAVISGVESQLSALASATPSANGKHIFSRYAVGEIPAVIDGQINAEEWADAATVNIANPEAKSPITLYVKNNAGFLYLAIDNPNQKWTDQDDMLGIIFDENNDGLWSPTTPGGEGLIVDYRTLTQFIGFRGYYPDRLGFDLPVSAAAVKTEHTNYSGHAQYELSFDLYAGPLNAMPGATTGFAIMLHDPDNFYTYHYGFAGEWPQGSLWECAATLGKLTLATATGVKEIEKNLPQNYILQQNYPNPFNAATEISFGLPEDKAVQIEIFDANGRQVAIVANGQYPAGHHQVRWNGMDQLGLAAPSGLYIYRMQAGEYISSRKASLIR